MRSPNSTKFSGGRVRVARSVALEPIGEGAAPAGNRRREVESRTELCRTRAQVDRVESWRCGAVAARELPGNHSSYRHGYFVGQQTGVG